MNTIPTDLVKNRQADNRKILERVAEWVEKYPDLRFIQILWAMNVVDNSDRFHEEPAITLKHIERVEENKKQMQES